MGAKVIKYSKSVSGAQSILSDKNDYLIVPCNQDGEIIISLSDDATLDNFQMINKEQFSSIIKKFSLSGSEIYPTKEWINLGEFEVDHDSKSWKRFEIENQSVIRFL